RLGGEALAARPCGQRPAGLGRVAERGRQVALEVAETDLADETAGRRIAHDPVAVAEERPVADVAQDARPYLFAGVRRAADDAGALGIGPHCGAGGEVLGSMAAESETLGVEDGDVGHGPIVARRVDKRRPLGPSQREMKPLAGVIREHARTRATALALG